jgi:aspartyl-tRNA(Asn)/glutamyl-tRNA(Gln) amidotransferase subunit B
VEILECPKRFKEAESETRRFDAAEGRTILMRTKSDDPDYRFFQDPDLPCIYISPQRVDSASAKLPELPFDQKVRFCEAYNLAVEQV